MLQEASVAVSASILRTLRDSFQLGHHIAALARFLLLFDGDFAVALVKGVR